MGTQNPGFRRLQSTQRNPSKEPGEWSYPPAGLDRCVLKLCSEAATPGPTRARLRHPPPPEQTFRACASCRCDP